jgi:hypothetical protein
MARTQTEAQKLAAVRRRIEAEVGALFAAAKTGRIAEAQGAAATIAAYVDSAIEYAQEFAQFAALALRHAPAAAARAREQIEAVRTDAELLDAEAAALERENAALRKRVAVLEAGARGTDLEI